MFGVLNERQSRQTCAHITAIRRAHYAVSCLKVNRHRSTDRIMMLANKPYITHDNHVALEATAVFTHAPQQAQSEWKTLKSQLFTE